MLKSYDTLNQNIVQNKLRVESPDVHHTAHDYPPTHLSLQSVDDDEENEFQVRDNFVVTNQKESSHNSNSNQNITKNQID